MDSPLYYLFAAVLFFCAGRFAVIVMRDSLRDHGAQALAALRRGGCPRCGGPTERANDVCPPCRRGGRA